MARLRADARTAERLPPPFDPAARWGSHWSDAVLPRHPGAGRPQLRRPRSLQQRRQRAAGEDQPGRWCTMSAVFFRTVDGEIINAAYVVTIYPNGLAELSG